MDASYLPYTCAGISVCTTFLLILLCNFICLLKNENVMIEYDEPYEISEEYDKPCRKMVMKDIDETKQRLIGTKTITYTAKEIDHVEKEEYTEKEIVGYKDETYKVDERVQTGTRTETINKVEYDTVYEKQPKQVSYLEYETVCVPKQDVYTEYVTESTYVYGEGYKQRTVPQTKTRYITVQETRQVQKYRTDYVDVPIRKERTVEVKQEVPVYGMKQVTKIRKIPIYEDKLKYRDKNIMKDVVKTREEPNYETYTEKVKKNVEEIIYKKSTRQIYNTKKRKCVNGSYIKRLAIFVILVIGLILSIIYTIKIINLPINDDDRTNNT